MLSNDVKQWCGMVGKTGCQESNKQIWFTNDAHICNSYDKCDGTLHDLEGFWFSTTIAKFKTINVSFYIWLKDNGNEVIEKYTIQ